MQPGPTADLACPLEGTVFTMSMPVAVSAAPVFRNRVAIAGTDGLDCQVSSEAFGAYWLHAGIVRRRDPAEVRAAAEHLWPLKVGNSARADHRYAGRPWTIRFKVASYEKITARVGRYDAAICSRR